MKFKKIFVHPRYPDKLKPLYELACNIWTLWDYDAITLFYRIDSRLFRSVGHNPLKFLHSLSKKTLSDLAEDEGFLYELNNVWEKFQNYLKYSRDFKEQCDDCCNISDSDKIAYFSMEFGLHECIHTYAGGLGILAGDYLKGASDLDLPVVGIGLLYRYGYFTQNIDLNGYQREIFTGFENHQIPITEVHDSQGNWATIKVKILNEEILVRLWKIEVGKIKLILLDTNVEANPPDLRTITDELYVADREKRIQQEIVLGIGGVKALELLEIEPSIYHFNEGHSAFAIIGRMDQLMNKQKRSFQESKALIRGSTVFTTHTPVIAGNENFPTDMVKKYTQPYLKDIEIAFDQFAKYGFINDDTNTFWLPGFGIQFSRFINGVSVQHADMSKQMWKSLFPEKHLMEIPIFPVTNGVHFSWLSQPFTEMFNRYLGPDYIHCKKDEDIWEKIYNIPSEELWQEHKRNKRNLVNFIKREFSGKASGGFSPRMELLGLNRILNDEYLTIVFARRFASYKRPTLILRNKERLKNILTNSQRPVQLIFAGKAHPADEGSKQMIKEVIDFASEYNLEDRVFFLENYDINIARHLYWGADVWLNNPITSMEASGTSGMKASMNGVLHLSTLEGWWLEGYHGNNGWAINAGAKYKNQEMQDIADANQIYDLIESEIAKWFYFRDESDVPIEWVEMMKNAIYTACRDYNMNRMICDYSKKAYQPSINYMNDITKDDCSKLKDSLDEEAKVEKYWDQIELSSFKTNIEKKGDVIEGETIEVNCEVRFGQAPSDLFMVELFYMLDDENEYEVLPMEKAETKAENITYKLDLEIQGYGTQSLNVRVLPANPIIQDTHPELIKWIE